MIKIHCTQRHKTVLYSMRVLFITLLATVLSAPGASCDGSDSTTLDVTIEGVYTIAPDDSKLLARTFALYRAKRAAAYQAADQFARQRLIQFATNDRDELSNLVADNLKADVLWERWESKGKRRMYRVRLRTVVTLPDFIDAQLESLALSRKESKDNYMNEMEPSLPEMLLPGHFLAKAYRLIRSLELRMAVIYLDRLTARYPNWQEAADLKNLALQQQPRS